MTNQIASIGAQSVSTRRPKRGVEFAPRLISRFEKLPEETKKAAQSALSKFPRPFLEKLEETDHRIVYTKGKEGWAAGSYDARDKIIYIAADPKGDSLSKETLLHETTHALCRVGWDEQNGFLKRLITPSREKDLARHDPELLKLHQEYRNRSLAGFGQSLSDTIDFRGAEDKGETRMGGRTFRYERSDKEITFSEKGTALGRIHEHARTDLSQGTLMSLGGALSFGAMAGATGPVAATVMAAIAIPLFVKGALAIRSGIRSAMREVGRPKSQSDSVKVSGKKVTVQLNQEIKPENKLTSSYAHTERQPEEYLAESMTMFLKDEESRATLKEGDPAMHDYCENWNILS